MGYTSEDKSSKVKQQLKICHNFQGSIMQDLPHVTQFVHNRHRHIALLNHYRELEDVISESNPQPCIPKAGFVAPLGKQLFWPCFTGFSSPW